MNVGSFDMLHLEEIPAGSEALTRLSISDVSFRDVQTLAQTGPEEYTRQSFGSLRSTLTVTILAHFLLFDSQLIHK